MTQRTPSPRPSLSIAPQPEAPPAPQRPSDLRPQYWETVPLAQMTPAEWEALCDGCGKCCLNKLEFEDTGEIVYTRVACRLLDRATCRCSDYANRRALVPECVHLTPAKMPEVAHWLPRSCAYLLLYQGKSLPAWHPLRTGRPDSTAEAGRSMRNRIVSEADVHEDDWEDYEIKGGL